MHRNNSTHLNTPTQSTKRSLSKRIQPSDNKKRKTNDANAQPINLSNSALGFFPQDKQSVAEEKTTVANDLKATQKRKKVTVYRIKAKPSPISRVFRRSREGSMSEYESEYDSAYNSDTDAGINLSRFQISSCVSSSDTEGHDNDDSQKKSAPAKGTSLLAEHTSS